MADFKIEYQGSSESFLKRLHAVPPILSYIKRHLDALGLSSAHHGLNMVKIFEAPARGRTAWHYDAGDDSISFFPLQANHRPDISLFSAFGQRHWEKNLSSNAKLQWAKALVFPNHRVLERFLDLIRHGRPYNDVLKRFKNPDDRLLVIHLINALVTNNVRPAQAKLLDLAHFPPTSHLVSANEAYSALPILRVHRPKHTQTNSYADAFGEFCTNNGKFLSSEPSVTKLYRGLFQAVTF